MGSSWVVLKGLGGVLGASGARFSWDSILDTILYPICNRFSLDLATFETCEKALWYYKNNSFEALRKFPNQTEKPKKIIGFWVLRGSIFPSWAALGGVQGVVLAILERLGGVLEPSWGICIKYMSRCHKYRIPMWIPEAPDRAVHFCTPPLVPPPPGEDFSDFLVAPGKGRDGETRSCSNTFKTPKGVGG